MGEEPGQHDQKVAERQQANMRNGRLLLEETHRDEQCFLRKCVGNVSILVGELDTDPPVEFIADVPQYIGIAPCKDRLQHGVTVEHAERALSADVLCYEGDRKLVCRILFWPS